MVVESVFCRMKTSRNIKMRKPTISADHSAAARVNLTADSGDARYSPGVAVGSTEVPMVCSGDGSAGNSACGGLSGDAEGSLVMSPSLPFQVANETNCHFHGECKSRRGGGHADSVRWSLRREDIGYVDCYAEHA